MDKRVIAGVLIAPLLLPVVTVALSTVGGGFDDSSFQAGVALAAFVAFFTYAVTIALGAPLVYWFRRRRWSDLWRYAVTGAVLGLAPLIVISRWGEIPLFLGPVFSLIGAASAAVFWVIAIRGNAAFHEA